MGVGLERWQRGEEHSALFLEDPDSTPRTHTATRPVNYGSKAPHAGCLLTLGESAARTWCTDDPQAGKTSIHTTHKKNKNKTHQNLLPIAGVGKWRLKSVRSGTCHASLCTRGETEARGWVSPNLPLTCNCRGRNCSRCQGDGSPTGASAGGALWPGLLDLPPLLVLAGPKDASSTGFHDNDASCPAPTHLRMPEVCVRASGVGEEDLHHVPPGKCSPRIRSAPPAPVGSGWASSSARLERCTFLVPAQMAGAARGRTGADQWESRSFGAMLLGSCSSQRASEEEGSSWVEPAIPSVGVRGRGGGGGDGDGGGGTGEFGAKPAGAWSPGELLCACAGR